MLPRRKHLTRLKRRVKRGLKNRQNIILAPPDNPLMFIILALIIFGVLAVFSAGAPEGADVYGNPVYYAVRHIIAIIIGSGFLFYFAKQDYRRLKYYAEPFAIFAIILMAATLIPGLGKESYGASRWLAGLPFQPSELAKLACILLFASVLVDAKTIFDSKFLKTGFLFLIMLAIVLKQPNLSMGIMMSAISVSLALVGGISFFPIGIMGISAIPFAISYVMSHPYQLKRITGWLDPWADPQGTGYNLIQSLYAIGSGGLLGVGFGYSKQKLFWLPFRHTDFIFAVIAEELGLIGCLVLIGLFLLLIYRGFLIANRCEDRFGQLLAFGITFSIGLQAFINIGVATGVLPVTGMTLPLISYGGSSVVVTMMMLGILLNISKKRIKKIIPKEEL